MIDSWQVQYAELLFTIKKRRRKMKITQDQAGAIIGCTGRTYRRIEAGDSPIDAAALFCLASHIGVTIHISVAQPPAGNRNHLSSLGGGSRP